MWQTKTICTFVAATVPVESAGARNPLLEEAQKIGEPAADTAQAPVNEPQTGSFEAFMSSFGSPQRWAGR